MFKKVIIIAGINWMSLTNGFVFGHVGSMIRSLHKREEGIDFAEAQISLIAFALTTTCIIGIALAAAVTDVIGRRWSFILFTLPNIANWLILFYAQELYQFILSRLLGGISVGAIVTLCIFVTAEYTSPNTRALILSMTTTVAPAIGTSIGHAIGVVLHWRTAALIALTATVLSIPIPYFWQESPHWLASKGRFEETKTAFRTLHGRNPDTERELNMIIKVENIKLNKTTDTTVKSTLQILFIAVKRKYFWDLLVLSVFIHAYLAAAGKFVFSVLATVILEEITSSSNVLLFTLLVDGFIVIGSCLSCVLIAKTSIRHLLFSTGITANAIMIIFSACSYFKNGQTYFNWINVCLLAIYFIIINAGPYPVLETVVGEMFPLELKLFIYSIAGSMFVASSALTIFLLPHIVSSMGYHGLFLLNAAIMSVSLAYVWLKLPETKGKTLQEIEMYFKANNFNVDEVLSNEQTMSLI